MALATWAVVSAGAAQPERAMGQLMRPQNLRCEYMVDPLGLDAPVPRLSWEVSDTRRGAVQTAYQVLVAETAADLGKDRGGDFVLKLTIPANTTAEVALPMGQGSQVLESGGPAEKAPGVRFVGMEETAYGAAGGGMQRIARYEVGAGSYEFKVPGYGAGG